jgi:polysaccharide biosynthesis transport protein
MDWNRVQGNWKQVKGRVKEKWGQLTDDDLDTINGRREQLEGKIQALGRSYDMVIVDLSALLPLVDVCLTARFIDGYLLVIEWGRTPSDVVTHALETASGIRDKLVGAVLNKTKTGQLQRFQRSGAMIDQSRLYARYGYTE